MTPQQYEILIRQYAEGKISWDLMKAKGVNSYLDVLSALGLLGLKLPTAPESTQSAGQSALRKLLQEQDA